jgi:hypothetical protein
LRQGAAQHFFDPGNERGRVEHRAAQFIHALQHRDQIVVKIGVVEIAGAETDDRNLFTRRWDGSQDQRQLILSGGPQWTRNRGAKACEQTRLHQLATRNFRSVSSIFAQHKSPCYANMATARKGSGSGQYISLSHLSRYLTFLGDSDSLVLASAVRSPDLVPGGRHDFPQRT